jgi:hypothetical protein
MPYSDRKRRKVFISYSQQDTKWLRRLQVHLRDLERRGLVEFWDDTKIRPGNEWRKEVDAALDSAAVAVLLISADFLASDFIAENVLPPLLSAAKRKGVTILPLILSPCLWEIIDDLAKFQSVNPPSKPLISLAKGEQEEYLVKLSKAILQAAEGGLEGRGIFESSGSVTRGGATKDPFPDSQIPGLQKNRRRIDAAVPSNSEVGHKIDLLVQVRFPDSPQLGIQDWPLKKKPASVEQAGDLAELSFPVDPRTGAIGPSRLKIRVIAPDFVIEGASEKILDVPPDQYSKLLTFLLSAKKPGSCRINVEVYEASPDCLGTIPIETAVGGVQAAPSVNIANLFFVVATSPVHLHAPGDRSVTIGGNVAGGAITTGDGNTIILGQDAPNTPVNGAAGENKERTQISAPPQAAASHDPTVVAVNTTSRRALIGTIAAAMIAMVGTIAAAVFANWGFVSNKSDPSVTGTVIDKSTEAPVRKAKISLDGDGPPKIMYTDTEGYFSFQLSDATKEIRIRIEADSYENYDQLIMPPKHLEIHLTSKTEKTSSLTGFVYDQNAPLQGARVTIEGFPGMQPEETTTEGVFTFEGLPSKAYDSVTIHVVKKGYQEHTQHVVIGDSPPRIKLKKEK